MKTLMRLRRSSLTVVLILLVAGGASLAKQNEAQRVDTERSYLPRVENAKVEKRNVVGTLAATMADLEKNATSPVWVGYAVAAVAGERTICCGNYSDSSAPWCGKCSLETVHEGWTGTKPHNGGIAGQQDRDSGANQNTVKLEGGQRLAVLFRLQDKHLTRVKLTSEDCVLDAGGLPFIWLSGVKTPDSVAFLSGYVLEGFANGSEKHSIGHEALTAIALHDGQEAEEALESSTAPTQPEELRKQAAFWLGAARGKEGFTALQRMAKKDPSTEVRAQVTFALSISKEPAALEEMIRMAHEDESGHVRGQAIFWLAQKAGKRAVSAIDSTIANDPDTDVKKQAVFALSQLPKDEGVPKLIQVAENNRNPEVRKQAMFWLGQSQDPRALGFFEKVLLK
ncbi:MAG TPA: HEAT repeat domain-containing protein [Candidatus Acidoferrales bacterium]|nr:HEAT repeat domain-containing protein [Candidatus Acidoferrales bacterium]